MSREGRGDAELLGVHMCGDMVPDVGQGHFRVRELKPTQTAAQSFVRQT